MGKKERDWWSNQKGITWSNETNSFVPRRGMKAIDAHTGDTYDLDNAADVQIGDYVNKDGKMYMEAKVTYFSDYPQANNPHKEGFLFERNSLNNEEARWNWKEGNSGDIKLNAEAFGYEGDEPIITGTVLIPIDREVNDRFLINQADKFIGINANQQNLRPGATLAADDAYRTSEYQRGIQQIMSEQGVDQAMAENIFSIMSQNSLRR
jgi:hypothetical protein